MTELACGQLPLEPLISIYYKDKGPLSSARVSTIAQSWRIRSGQTGQIFVSFTKVSLMRQPFDYAVVLKGMFGDFRLVLMACWKAIICDIKHFT